MINIVVRDKIAHGDGTVIVCENTGYHVHWDLDAEWATHTLKTMRVIVGGSYKDVVFSGDTAELPAVENTLSVKIGLFAGDLSTTTPAFFDCKKSILSGCGTPAAPSEDVYAQLVSLVESGMLQGDKGDDGKSIVAIRKTDTVGLVDTYTISYSDGAKSTFEVKNGADGEDAVGAASAEDVNALIDAINNVLDTVIGGAADEPA